MANDNLQIKPEVISRLKRLVKISQLIGIDNINLISFN